MTLASSSTTAADRIRRISVGTKLATATIAIIAVVTVGIYFELTRYQRENLLRSKELSAAAVTRLFSDSCAAAVVFEDDAAVKTALATLARNDDVGYAGVWAVNSAGSATRLVGELRRGPAEAATNAPPAVRIQRLADRVVVTSPVRDEIGQLVAVAVVAFSLARENGATAQVQRTTLIVSSSVALVLVLLLMMIARMAIVGPLGKLVLAAKDLEEGRRAEVDIRTSDEVGQLAHAFRSMATAIEVREGRIVARNRDMRLVLDNVGQGFVTIGPDGTMSEERSRIISDWFGPAVGAVKFWDLVHEIDPSVAQLFELGWLAITEGFLPFDLLVDQLPARLRQQDRTFELAYRPITEGECLTLMVVVITDVTARIARERAERAQRETMSLFRRMLVDRAALDEFFAEGDTLVDGITGIVAAPPIEVVRRQIHTLKGNAALFGIESVAELCHVLEDRMADTGELPTAADRETLRSQWRKTLEMRAELTGSSVPGALRLEPGEHAAFVEQLRQRESHELLLGAALSWALEPASRRLTLLGEQARSLAQRLGKSDLQVTCAPTALRLPPGKWGAVWAVLAHLVRNAVDHGIETAEERAAAGKPKYGTIWLSLTREGNEVVVAIRDDGRGIDWPTIAARAAIEGFPHNTPADLEAALLADGFSSRDCANATSGRGIGMAAVNATARELGGRVEIHSRAGAGCTFRMILPESLLWDGPGLGERTAVLRPAYV